MTSNAYSAGSYPEGSRYEAGAPITVRRRGGLATTALVLGILALVLSITVVGGVVLGIAAIVTGVMSYRRCARGQAEGRGRAIGGLVTGGIGLVLSALLIVLGVSLLNSTKVKNLESCLRGAGNNQAQVQQCKTQYQNAN